MMGLPGRHVVLISPRLGVVCKQLLGVSVDCDCDSLERSKRCLPRLVMTLVSWTRWIRFGSIASHAVCAPREELHGHIYLFAEYENVIELSMVKRGRLIRAAEIIKSGIVGVERV